MLSFFLCLAILIIGYFTYGKVVEKTLKPRPLKSTMALTMW